MHGQHQAIAYVQMPGLQVLHRPGRPGKGTVIKGQLRRLGVVAIEHQGAIGREGLADLDKRVSPQFGWRYAMGYHPPAVFESGKRVVVRIAQAVLDARRRQGQA